MYLDTLKEYIESNHLNIYRITEIKNGQTRTVDLVPTSRCHNIYSVSKAFAVTAVGLLYDRGLLSPDDRVVDLLGNAWPRQAAPGWETVTLDEVLSHKLGLPGGFLDIDVADTCAFGRDHLQTLAACPLQGRGQRGYSDGAYYLAARVVTAVAGVPYQTFLWQNLLYPLRVRETAFSADPAGYAIGASGLYLHTEDMAKLGQLYLTEGGGLLSPEWVRLVLEREYELRPLAHGAVGKGGMYGQMLLLQPAAGRVVAWQGFLRNGAAALTEFAAALT